VDKHQNPEKEVDGMKQNGLEKRLASSNKCTYNHGQLTLGDTEAASQKKPGGQG